MPASHLLPLLVALLALVAAGCGSEDPAPLPSSCTGAPEDIVRALEQAPDRVELPDGATISDCLRAATTDADLQNVGVALSRAAENLEELAMEGDADAATQLGYLVGAARRGAETTSGVGAELVRRLERSAGVDVTAVEDALMAGIEAGEEHG